MDKNKKKVQNRLRKKFSVRKLISGTPERPRLSVFRSNKNIYAQIIDDTTGKTLVAASTLDKEVAEEVKAAKGKIELSNIVGKLVAKRALENNITTVVFDRNGYLYHGRVKAVAESAREAGLKI